jgi:dCTP diphosphatase
LELSFYINKINQEITQDMAKSDLNTIKQLMREFADTRDWNQFHSPKNLAMALSVEVAELVEHFQWLNEEQSKNLSQDKLDAVAHELADTLLYLVRLADKLNIDLLSATLNKMELNNKKYPVDKSRGNAKKYTEFA